MKTIETVSDERMNEKMFWYFPRPSPPKLAYLALVLIVIAFFTPGIYFTAMDDQPISQDMLGRNGFLLGTTLSLLSFALALYAFFYYRKKDDEVGRKFARTVIVVSGVVLTLHVGMVILFITT